MAGYRGSIHNGDRFFSSPLCSDRLWVSSSLPYRGRRGLCPRESRVGVCNKPHLLTKVKKERSCNSTLLYSISGVVVNSAEGIFSFTGEMARRLHILQALKTHTLLMKFPVRNLHHIFWDLMISY
jgi:hypothetical protein